MKNRKLLHLPCYLAAFLALASTAQAASYYMTKLGAGARTGADWANAFSASKQSGSSVVFDNAILNTTMQPGDTLYLEGGNYGSMGFQISSAGTSALRKTLIGVDRGAGLPLFQSSTRGYWGPGILAGSHYWTVKNLKMNTWKVGFSVSTSNGVILDNLTTYNTNDYGYYISQCDNILVQNCRADRYSDTGFNVQFGCDGVTFKNCVADCPGNGISDPAWYVGTHSPKGFDFHDKVATTQPFNTQILIEDCATFNNYSDPAYEGYQQGDGIMIQGRNSNITIRRTRSVGASDAAMDLKGTPLLIESCQAVTTRFGFKTWDNATLTNCIATHNWAAGLHMAGPSSSGVVTTANYCTVYKTSNGNGSWAVNVESGSNQYVLNNCVLTFSAAAGTYWGGPGAKTSNGTVLHANAANTANPPKFLAPGAWNGTGTNYNNQTYGLTKGYNSAGGQGGAAIIFEAEGLTTTSTGATASDLTEASASGGQYNDLPAAGAGATVTYTVNVPAAGNYNVKIRHRVHTNRGIGQLAIDAVNQGSTVDTYAATPSYIEVDHGTKNFSSSGNKLFRFTVTGKNASSSGFSYSIDYIKLTPQ